MMVNINKKEQIIVRLDSKTKKQLQEVADDLNIDMSKLIRDKIDEIIEEHNLSKENKRIIGEENVFIENNPSLFMNKIIDKKVMLEIRESFKEMLLNKMESEINNTDFKKILINDNEDNDRDKK